MANICKHMCKYLFTGNVKLKGIKLRIKPDIKDWSFMSVHIYKFDCRRSPEYHKDLVQEFIVKSVYRT